MNYNSSGELWFISKQVWTGDECDPAGPVTQSIHEFRTNGRAMRLTRQRNPEFPNVTMAGTTQWHDFAGDEAYADSGVSVAPNGGPVTLTALASREPGIGMKDMQTGNTSYFHGDQIGSLRAVTDTPTSGDANVTGRIIYTAFGERVWDNGTIGTRHQYAGAWGYDTSDAYDSGLSPSFGGTPGDEVPFVHVGHRWYDPASGRFLQRDPIGIWGGLNVYEYVRSGPIKRVDPLGLLSPLPNPLDMTISQWFTTPIAPLACRALIHVVMATPTGILATYGGLAAGAAGVGWTVGEFLDDCFNISDTVGEGFWFWTGEIPYNPNYRPW